MLLKNAKKTNPMTGRFHFYLELENIKIRHQVYVLLVLHSLSISKYCKVLRLRY